jgi:putative colanic acid biosynthesis acetyltransferase WcaB
MKRLEMDLRRNKNNTKGAFISIGFRFSSGVAELSRSSKLCRILSAPISLAYKIIFDYLMCIHIPPSTRIGGGLVVYHGFGIVINETAIIGDNVTIRQNVTIGVSGRDGDHGTPVIGNNVDIGAGAIILGPVNVGDNAKIGAGAVVVKDVPKNSVVVGPQARLIGSRINL